MYCITRKIIRLSQVIYANGSQKLFRFRVRQFSGLKYYFTWKITPFRNLFSVCPGFRYIGDPFQAGFTVLRMSMRTKKKKRKDNEEHSGILFVESVRNESTSSPSFCLSVSLQFPFQNNWEVFRLNLILVVYIKAYRMRPNLVPIGLQCSVQDVLFCFVPF